MDKNGYPTEQELEYIRLFDVSKNNWEDLMGYIQAHCWHWGNNYFYKGVTQWNACTGGWSGNEEVIAALKQNTMFWMLYWKQSNRGGKYIFEKMRKAESEE